MAYQMISEVPFRSGGYDGPGFLEGFGERKPPACPPFKFTCNPDCPFPNSHCKTRKQELCERILGAINLAKRAASLLEAKPGPITVALFRQVFDQAPSDKWEVPGHPGRTIPAGELVARRFRAVANELLTSDTTYRCVDDNRCKTMKSKGGCSGVEVIPLGGLGNFQIVERPGGDVLRPDLVPVTPSPSRSCHPTETIVVDNVAMAILCKNEVWLCPPFWQLKKFWQEGTILHEMFHLCFGLTCSWFQHDQKERRRNSAYCYEVFASGGAADPVSVAACKALPK